MKVMQTVDLFEGSPYQIPHNDGTLVHFIQWLEKLNQKIPQQHRNTARVEIESELDYGDSSKATIRVFYSRPETDEEEEARERKHKETRLNAKAYLEQQLAAINKELGK